MDDEKRKTWGYWLTIAAKVLAYFATAIAGGVIGAGCKNGALINLC